MTIKLSASNPKKRAELVAHQYGALRARKKKK